MQSLTHSALYKPNNWRSKWACVQCKASSTRGTWRNVIHCWLSAIMPKQVFDEYDLGTLVGKQAQLTRDPSSHKGVLGVWRFIFRKGRLEKIDMGRGRSFKGTGHTRVRTHTHTNSHGGRLLPSKMKSSFNDETLHKLDVCRQDVHGFMKP